MEGLKVHSFQNIALKEIIFSYQETNSTAEKHLRKYFKEHKKLGSRDRKQIAGWFYTYIKHKIFLEAAGKVPTDKNADLFPEEFIELLQQIDQTPKSEKLALLKSVTTEKKLSDAQLVSYPDWILEKWTAQQKNALEIASYSLSPSKTFIRFNRSLVNEQEIARIVKDEDLKIALDENLGVYYTEAKNLQTSKEFKAGKIEVQDYGSQQIATFLGVKTNELVIDACCGAGGKTLHLADLMKNTGKIWALDPRIKALEEASDRADRAGIENVEFFEIPENPEEVQFPFQAQKLLIDAPCSGSGTFSRNPDRKYRLTQEELAKLVELQAKILREYAKWVYPDGTMVYATCSTFHEENAGQIENFLKTNENWQLDEEKMIWPSSEHDGFYMARLKRKA